MGGEPLECLGGITNDRPARDVVEHHGKFGGIGHGDGVLVDALLGGSGVIGRDHQEPVRPSLSGLLSHADRVLGIVRSCPGHDESPLPDSLDDGADELGFLLGMGCRRLPGRAIEHEAVMAVVDQVQGQRRGGVEVDRSVVRHGGDHGRQQAPERLRW